MKCADRTGLITVYVWEGEAQLVDRVERCVGSAEIRIIKTDDIAISPFTDSTRASLAVISTAVVKASSAALSECQRAAAMLIIWIGAVPTGALAHFLEHSAKTRSVGAIDT
jgi:hypothetical protein